MELIKISKILYKSKEKFFGPNIVSAITFLFMKMITTFLIFQKKIILGALIILKVFDDDKHTKRQIDQLWL